MDIDKEALGVISRSMDDFGYFCEKVLGYRESVEYGYYDLTQEHRELCRFMSGPGMSKMVLMPRYSFKSAIVTCGYTMWELIRNPNLRILIYSDSAGKASGFLQDIKNHIMGQAPNSEFRKYFPRWETDPHSGKWNDSEILIRAREIALREPTVDTGGIDTSKVGKHFDLIFFDDIVSDLNVTTKDQMDKVHNCYKKALSLLKPGGKIVVCGTRWHHGDCYGRIIAENRDKSNFKVFIRDAEEKRGGRLIFSSIGLTREFLDYQRKEQGSYLYSCLYRLNPVDDETALFKESGFRFYKPAGLDKNRFYITGTCDPAGEGEDFTAVTVVGTDCHRRMYLLDAVCQHMNPDQIVSQVIRLNYKWGFDRFSCEKNFFQGMLQKEFRRQEEDHRKNANYKPFSFHEDIISTSKARNFNRVLSLQPYHERGDLFFPNHSENPSLNTLNSVYAELAHQMLQFTIDGSKSPHDDLLISLSQHIGIIAQGKSSADKEPPVTSAAWFEREYIKKFDELNRHRPLRHREFLTPAFN